MQKKGKYLKKTEWSKIIATILIIYGIACGILYYIAVFMDKYPDSALAVQSVITIMGAFGEYLLYQASLKLSRNRHGISSDGTPYNIQTSHSSWNNKAPSNKYTGNKIDMSLDNTSGQKLENEKE